MSGTIKRILFLFISVIVLWQCTETKEVDPEIWNTQYFPLNVGDYRIYLVEGARYYSFNDSVPFSYKLKESVVDSFTNLEGGISYKIQRDKLNESNQIWELDSIWTARIDDNRSAISVESNIPLVKLTFPIEENKVWDGNRLNDADADEFEMTNIDQEYSNDFDAFEKTVTVIQEELRDTVVYTILREEVFAHDIGLVYKENVKKNFQLEYIISGNDTIEIISKFQSGFMYYQHLVEYGKE